ncbi:MAG: hypothetical protein SchgKO_08740 [Schleiferiaceae bacterium]
MKKFLSVWALALVAMACSTSDYQSEMDELKQLQSTVDSLQNQVASINADTLAKWNAYANSRASVIKRKLRDTAFANKHIDIISEVIADAKYLQKMAKDRSDFTQELTYASEQLEKLMVDLKNNALDSAQVYEFMASERMAVLTLQNNVTKRVPLAAQAIETMDSLSVELDSLMNYMDQNGYFNP